MSCFVGKSYGNPANQMALVIHGLQDNCGSFDRLLPYLPQSFYYVCIDLPSHGKSSYMPGNFYIHSIDYILVYKLIFDHFNRKKYIIIGHSYGGQIGILFSQLYPEYVLKLIMLDTVYFFPYTPLTFKHAMEDYSKEYVKIAENQSSPNTRPTYTYEAALNRLITNRKYGYLNKEAAEPILKRNTEKLADGKYRFTLDPRLKLVMNPGYTMQTIVQMVKKIPVQCPHILILTANTPQQQWFKPVIQVLKTNKKCKIVLVRGDHDVHNKHPERVAPHIAKFLLNSKL